VWDVTLTLALRDGAKVVVTPSGTILYHSVTGRTYRQTGRGSYEESATWVKQESAWRREVKFSVETVQG
jgi:hypothetical protein